MAKSKKTNDQSPKKTWTVSHIVAYLISSNLAEAGKPTSEEDTQAMEQKLGLKFPGAYRAFIAEFGALSVNGDDILGSELAFPDALLRSVQDATQFMRDFEEIEWPAPALCVCDDGRGGWICLDTSRIKNDDCPVIYFDHELVEFDEDLDRARPTFEKVAPSFKAWLLRIADGQSPLDID